LSVQCPRNNSGGYGCKPGINTLSDSSGKGETGYYDGTTSVVIEMGVVVASVVVRIDVERRRIVVV